MLRGTAEVIKLWLSICYSLLHYLSLFYSVLSLFTMATKCWCINIDHARKQTLKRHHISPSITSQSITPNNTPTSCTIILYPLLCLSPQHHLHTYRTYTPPLHPRSSRPPHTCNYNNVILRYIYSLPAPSALPHLHLCFHLVPQRARSTLKEGKSS